MKVFEIVERQTVAYVRGGCFVIQQAPMIGDGPDSLVYLDRKDALKLRDAINTWDATADLGTENAG